MLVRCKKIMAIILNVISVYIFLHVRSSQLDGKLPSVVGVQSHRVDKLIVWTLPFLTPLIRVFSVLVSILCFRCKYGICIGLGIDSFL